MSTLGPGTSDYIFGVVLDHHLGRVGVLLRYLGAGLSSTSAFLVINIEHDRRLLKACAPSVSCFHHIWQKRPVFVTVVFIIPFS